MFPQFSQLIACILLESEINVQLSTERSDCSLPYTTSFILEMNESIRDIFED